MSDLNPYPGTIKRHEVIDGRKPSIIQHNRWYSNFDKVRAALGDRCVLDSTVNEVIACVEELSDFARKNGFEPKSMKK